MQIRRIGVSEWAQVREVCCLTGKAGDPIASERWPLFSEIWIGPYQKLRPNWCLVAVEGKEVAGYLTGCPDTLVFELQKRITFTPWLVLQAGIGRYRGHPDARRLLRRTFHLEGRPEQMFSTATRKTLRQDFPAHLHINVKEKWRSTGLGHQLVEAYIHALKKENVSGVHVFCGEKPVRFYERMGFHILEKIEFSQNVWVWALGKRLDS